jgi:hypothetical protein
VKINRRKLLSAIGLGSTVFATDSTLLAGSKRVPPVLRGNKIEVLNPKGTPPGVQLIPMAKRLDSLDNKTVFLVSDGFDGASRFLNQIKIWFSKNMPNVTTFYWPQELGLGRNDPKLLEELKARGNGVIMAYGH